MDTTHAASASKLLSTVNIWLHIQYNITALLNNGMYSNDVSVKWKLICVFV